MYKRKTKDVWVVMGNYNGEWEELYRVDTYKEAKADYIAYCENEKGYAHKIEKKRERL